MNDAHGTDIAPDDLRKIRVETLKSEAEFNRQAGFTEKDDELPEFFASESLLPTGNKVQLFSSELNRVMPEKISLA